MEKIEKNKMGSMLMGNDEAHEDALKRTLNPENLTELQKECLEGNKGEVEK